MKATIKKTLTASAIMLTFFYSACAAPVSGNSKSEEYNSSYKFTEVSSSDYENMEAQQFTKLMGNGINLGNTMEATGPWLGYSQKDASNYETAWGQPKTTKAMFEAMKKAGFDSVRIPVAWTHTMDWSNGDFEINKNYLERVAQVVNWALDSDLYVMINDHWDYQWWGLFSHDQELAFKIYKEMWSQVGEYFKDYSYKLIFEGGNEELGDRFNDTVDSKVDSRLKNVNYSSRGTLMQNDCYKLLTQVTQLFVDTIRAQGGNNAKRFLLIPGYDTDIGKTTDSRYVMPTDSRNKIQKLIISVHYYTPSTYCILSENASWGRVRNSWGTANDYTAMQNDFKKMTKFIDAGYGVIIGEYGVAQKKESNGSYTKKEGMEKWLTAVLDNCDENNYCPFLWDCNTFFKKNGTLGFTDPEVAAVYKNRK